MKLVDACPDLKEFPLANTSSYFRYDSESDPDVASNAVSDRLMYFYQAQHRHHLWSQNTQHRLLTFSPEVTPPPSVLKAHRSFDLKGHPLLVFATQMPQSS